MPLKISDYEEKIQEIVYDNDGIRAEEIARLLSIPVKQVQEILKKSNKCYMGENAQWHIRKAIGFKASNKPDLLLHKLCKYYLDCIGYDRDDKVITWLNSQDYVFIDGIKRKNVLSTEGSDLLKKAKNAKDKSVYVGYPVEFIPRTSSKGAKTYCLLPILLFPVDLQTGEVSNIPIINMEAVRAHAVETEYNFIYECIDIEQKIGLDECDLVDDIGSIIEKIQNVLPWAWKECICLENINIGNNSSKIDEPGIYNKAILLMANRTVFTQGLESELSKLSQVPEDTYVGTALYSLLHPTGENLNDSLNEELLEVLPLNLEQRHAIELALKEKVTVITGPPGTGKSQVVSDLLINMAWHGKSVLFASKNNKAVDVVESRVNSLATRPIVLRLGDATHATRINQLIQSYMSAPEITSEEIEDYELCKEAYIKDYKECEELRKQKARYIDIRNRIDEIEQNLCLNNKWRNLYKKVDKTQLIELPVIYNKCTECSLRADKERQNIFIKLIWPYIKESRTQDYVKSIRMLNSEITKYGFCPIEISAFANADIKREIERFLKYMDTLKEYETLLSELKNLKTLESIDREIYENKTGISNKAYYLWQKWLLKTRSVPDSDLRTKMTRYSSILHLLSAPDTKVTPELRSKMLEISRNLEAFFPCYAITSLSANKRIPFVAGLYDLVVIDEASQCDIASALPLLYRAKRAVIIGDPKQLTHITKLSSAQNLRLLTTFNITEEWSYSTISLFNLAHAKVNANKIINLRDHHRSHKDIINFSNIEFYDDTLRIATDYKKLKAPKGTELGITWKNIKGRTVRPSNGGAYNVQEISVILEELRMLASSGYKGSIGVVTPFRAQAERISWALEKDPSLIYYLEHENDFLVDTVHKFQGDEKDLMIFSAVISDGTRDSALGFLKSTGNLFNVAITRARSVLIVIGDKNYCSNSRVPYLEDFVAYVNKLSDIEMNCGIDYPNCREYPKMSSSDVVSDWEIHFYQALYDAGIKTIPQYPVDKYKLDLAIIKDGAKLDIEVDGERYHKVWNGELCYRDQLRNQRLFELGWDVKRFWVYQIRDELDWCVEQIKQWVNVNS